MLNVKIVDGAVKEVWDTAPPAGDTGWVPAIEVRPAIIAHRQRYTAHRFDLTKVPVEIIYDVVEISVADRKASMRSNAGFAAKQMERQSKMPGTKITAAELLAAQAAVGPKQLAIDACTTHDQLDAIK